VRELEKKKRAVSLFHSLSLSSLGSKERVKEEEGLEEERALSLSLLLLATRLSLSLSLYLSLLKRVCVYRVCKILKRKKVNFLNFFFFHFCSFLRITRAR
jgi:hypothetical protein